MTEAEKQLLTYLKERSLKFGNFTLASGQESSYFIDGKMVQGYSRSARAIGEVIYERTEDLDVAAIGGLALGAVPLISTLTMLSHQKGRPVSGFFVRREVKDHGTRKLLEGLRKDESMQGKKVVIIDDVTTTGGSSMIAVDAVHEAGGEVILGLSVVDREQGAAETYGKRGIPFRAVFSARDFLNS